MQLELAVTKCRDMAGEWIQRGRLPPLSFKTASLLVNSMIAYIKDSIRY
jgi:hypothetical protein